MSWSYDPTILDDTTIGRRNQVRLLIGDVDTTDEQLQDEEIDHFLSLVGDNVYTAAIIAAKSLMALYSRLVNKSVGSISIDYAERRDNYAQLIDELRALRREVSPAAAPVFFGGDEDRRIFGIGMHDLNSEDGNFVESED